ncbi:ABC transporter ATP-binding protein [Mesorhizobium sp. RP14(2022)]|uniref:ABC transporter ATP-binding protein n=2 Tax=Mesorhizobium liriopis TaxID=2953882 RepID=A0ABT1C354_9HYPH|nr:ABC transporter ATP-binding protein [Mesorhizobium liriopis]MCO6049239.1 ABC transporter ATP-binding protein [Mesorhizobium liriopis]
MTNSDTILAVKGLGKSFGSLVAVDDVSFTIRRGEILGIAGPNGAGKTTLFNLLSRNPIVADRGHVIFDGQRIDRLSPHRIFRAGLARTFQKETAFFKLTVAENVRLGAVYGAGLRGAAANAAVNAALEMLELTPLKHQEAGALTVYGTKRLMIASAMVASPKLLLMDEPASGLNTIEQAELKTLILRLRDQGTSILLIEHILPLLFGVSERVMVMDFGRKLTEGSPAEIARDPRVIDAYLGGVNSESAHAA